MEDNKKKFTAFAIVERRGQKSQWMRLGPAFENKDGSMTAFINSLPFDVFASGELKLNIREDKPKDEQGESEPYSGQF